MIDVRSPSEFKEGHIPGSQNIALLSDEERHHVGLLYKTEGFDQAYRLALSFVGPKMTSFLETLDTLNITKETPLTLYCARGGMRSHSMSWLFSQAGYAVTCLPGGYKKYRNQVLQSFKIPLQLMVVGGYTGVGKTEFLSSLNHQVLDLEELACHRGSAFGGNSSAQPTTEQFENEIYEKLQIFSLNDPIWVEDESRLIGKVAIPHLLYEQMQSATLHLLKASQEERVERILKTYIPKSPEEKQLRLQQIRSLQKRLGLEKTKKALDHVEQEEYKEVILLLLGYYDSCYENKMKKRKIHEL